VQRAAITDPRSSGDSQITEVTGGRENEEGSDAKAKELWASIWERIWERNQYPPALNVPFRSLNAR
jgi:hypothetical protein